MCWTSGVSFFPPVVAYKRALLSLLRACHLHTLPANSFDLLKAAGCKVEFQAYDFMGGWLAGWVVRGHG